MRIKKMAWGLVMLAFLSIPLAIQSCGSPAAPPSPPVETPVPIVLKFVEPADIAIDVSTIGAAPSISVYDAVGAGGEYSAEIAAGSMAVQYIQALLETMMSGINEMEIPVGESITTYQTVHTFTSATGFLEGTHEVKIDFAAFDFDGDGAAEGCSGHTAALPVCARIWVDGARYAAWVMSAYYFKDDPNVADNPGAGRFKSYVTGLAGEYFGQVFNATDRISLASVYDHQNAEDVSTEMFSRLLQDDIELRGPCTITAEGHAEIAQEGLPESAKKSLNLVSVSSRQWHDDLSIEKILEQRYLGQFREDQDFWGGSWYSEYLSVPDNDNFTNVCARISTGDAVEPDLANICDELGISVAGMAFTRYLVDADVDFFDFPTTPPM